MNRKAGRTEFRETGEQSKREMRVLELENRIRMEIIRRL